MTDSVSAQEQPHTAPVEPLAAPVAAAPTEAGAPPQRTGGSRRGGRNRRNADGRQAPRSAEGAEGATVPAGAPGPRAPQRGHPALLEVYRRKKARATDDLLPKLRNRMIAAFEASGLTREAYTELVQSRDD